MTAVAANAGIVYAVVDGQLHRIDQDKLVHVGASSSAIERLFELDGTVWYTAADGIYRLSATDATPTRVSQHRFVDLCKHNGIDLRGDKERRVSL